MNNLTWQAVIKPSRHFAFLLLALHLGSAIVVYLTNITWAVKLISLALIASSLLFFWTRDIWLRLPNSWREITLRKNDVSIGVQDGSILTGQLANTSVVFSGFVILLVRLDGRRINTSRVIFQDALHPEAFRELCVYLKFAS